MASDREAAEQAPMRLWLCTEDNPRGTTTSLIAAPTAEEALSEFKRSDEKGSSAHGLRGWGDYFVWEVTEVQTPGGGSVALSALLALLSAPADATIPSDALTPPPEHQPKEEPVGDALLNEIRQGFGRRGIQTFTGGQTAGEGVWVTVLGTPKQFRHVLAPDDDALTPQQVERAVRESLSKFTYEGQAGWCYQLENHEAEFAQVLSEALTHSTSDANTGEEGSQ